MINLGVKFWDTLYTENQHARDGGQVSKVLLIARI